MRSKKREADIQRQWDRAKKWLDRANLYALWADVARTGDDISGDFREFIKFEKLRGYALRKAQRALEGR
jgi:hypothetical protein